MTKKGIEITSKIASLIALISTMLFLSTMNIENLSLTLQIIVGIMVVSVTLPALISFDWE